MSTTEGLKLLNLLGKPIYDVDGQCWVCREAFIEQANKIFMENSLPYRFRTVETRSDTGLIREYVEAYCAGGEVGA